MVEREGKEILSTLLQNGILEMHSSVRRTRWNCWVTNKGTKSLKSLFLLPRNFVCYFALLAGLCMRKVTSKQLICVLSVTLLIWPLGGWFCQHSAQKLKQKTGTTQSLGPYCVTYWKPLHCWNYAHYYSLQSHLEFNSRPSADHLVKSGEDEYLFAESYNSICKPVVIRCWQFLVL